MPQRHKLNAAEKKTQAKLKKEKAYAFYDAGAKKYTAPKKPAPTKPTGLQKSEGIRKKYTPTGLQSMIDVMGQKKKAKGKY